MDLVPENEDAQELAETPKTSKLAEIQKLAEAFAAEIPDGRFSAAEIQGFLIGHRKDPKEAVDSIRSWVERNGKSSEDPEDRCSLSAVANQRDHV